MRDIDIRDARPADRQAVRDLTLRSFEEYAPLMSSHWEYYRENIVETLGRDEPVDRIVAERHGTIVGSVLLYPAGRKVSSPDGVASIAAWPEVRLLAVDPGARGRGIGKALMDECVRRARDSGSRFLTLRTNDMMRAAVHLYEKMGFERFSEQDFVVDGRVIVKAYRLDLSGSHPAGDWQE